MVIDTPVEPWLDIPMSNTATTQAVRATVKGLGGKVGGQVQVLTVDGRVVRKPGAAPAGELANVTVVRSHGMLDLVADTGERVGRIGAATKVWGVPS